MQKKYRQLIWLWLSLFIICLDQLTKLWISHTIVLFDSIKLVPYLNFTLMHNRGAAFSFLQSQSGWQVWILGANALIVSLIIIVWMSRLKPREYWLACALAFILGGAVGNLTDRILYGYVIDFIDFYVGQWHWPVFNIADSAIFVGAVMLFLSLFRKTKQD